MENSSLKNREVTIKRFMASIERRKQRIAEITQSLREDYKAKTGEYPKYVEIW